MSFVTAALIGGGVALASGYLGSQAAGKAASQQAGAANNATAAQLQMFNTQNEQQAPYRQAGQVALSSLLSGLGLSYGDSSNPAYQSTYNKLVNQFDADHRAKYGIGINDPGVNVQSRDATLQTFRDQAMQAAKDAGQSSGAGGVDSGYFTHQFDANDLKTNLAPNYDFMLQQGIGATKNAGNLQTGLLSGNTLKGVADYAENYAGNAYQNAFNNYTANQSNIFNRLSSIAGLGQTANQATGQLAGQTSQGVASSLQNAGAAQAAGTVGQANALTGAANNALGWYSLSQMMNQGGNV